MLTPEDIEWLSQHSKVDAFPKERYNSATFEQGSKEHNRLARDQGVVRYMGGVYRFKEHFFWRYLAGNTLGSLSKGSMST